MAELTVTPVSSKREEKAFIKFQWKIYEGNPSWVPPLLIDRRKLIDRKNNPFYAHADVEFFLARTEGEIVGRIAAIVNHNHNKEHKENIGFFGFFESVNDQSVATALLDSAKQWLKERGVTAMRGPASPSVNDEYGLLVDGFDKPPVILMPYNPAYYVDLIEQAGLKPIKNMYSYELRQETVYNEKFVRVGELIKRKVGLTFRGLRMNDFRNEIERVRDLYNLCWQHNWGAVPMTREEFDAVAKDFRPIVVPDLVIFAEVQGKPIGFALSLPDLNQALIYNKKGYLLPGLARLMIHRKKIDLVRVLVLGVLPEYKMSGAAAGLFYETARRAEGLGYRRGEAGWVLEDNEMMIRAAEAMNAVRYKQYRLYETPLGG
jgi:GNAT superfamily N-acetyltransferase